MSAFSRGCSFGLRTFKTPESAHNVFQKSFYPTRFFTTSHLLHAKKSKAVRNLQKAILSSAPKPSATSATLTAPKLPAYEPYASTLGKKSHSTLLYTAPSHTGYRIASYGTGTLCIAWATYYVNTVVLYPNAGLHYSIPYLFGIASLISCAWGFRLYFNASRLIRSMTAIPLASKSGPSKVQIEITVRRSIPIPFLKPRKLLVAPEDIIITRPVVPPQKRQTQTELQYQRKMEEAEKAKRKADWEYDQTHLMTSPFRHARRAFGDGLGALMRTLSFNEAGFLKMRVNGKQLKMDVSGGWVLEGGKAIDRLVKLEPHVSRF